MPDPYRQTVLVVMLVLGLIGTGPVRADVDPSRASVDQDVRDDAASLHRELLAFPRATISAAEAIGAAERRVAGSKAVDISFDGRGERLMYDVKTIRSGKVWEGRIDATTGAMIGSGTEMPIDRFPADDRRRMADLADSTMGISDAISIAETYGSGKAISAGLNGSDGHLTFLVVVVSGGQLKAVSIDPADVPTAANTPNNARPTSAR